VTTEKQQIFSMVIGSLYKELCREERFSRNSDVRGLSVQLWSVNQRTTEAEEVADSEIRTKSVTVEEETLVVQ
jgi:hypothetical protein